MSAMDLALDIDRLEHLGLIGPGSNLEASKGNGDSIGGLPAGCFGKCIV